MADDLKEFIQEQGEETRRHFDVVAEDLKSDIQTVAEQVAQNSENITAVKEDVAGLKEDMGTVKGRLDVIQMDIEFIKNELKQKVSRDEFAILEKRLSALEIRFGQNS